MNVNNVIKWSPKNYLDTAVIAQEAETEMLNRLQWMTINPKLIVDMGCGTGNASKQLKLLYPEAQVIGVDHSMEMLSHAQQHATCDHYLCANADCIPMLDHTVDLIFANFLLPWHTQPNELFHAWRTLLREDGLLLLSALGPDTVKEIQHLVTADGLPMLADMHVIGDLLLQKKFVDPVLDVNYISTTYRDTTRMVTDLIGSGILLNDIEMPSGNEQVLELTYEVIYAHAFAPPIINGVVSANNNHADVHVPLTELRRMLKR